MFELIVAAAALWVCPGELYTNEPTTGCRPLEESSKEGFSRIPEATEEGKTQVPSTIAERPSQQATSNETETATLCSLYKEYVELGLKTQGGFKNDSTDQIDRWQTLRRMFQGTAPPNCP
ncbi:hypothetical protein [Nitrospira sp. Nam74]